MKTYLKIKRAIRYLFYKHISVEDQLKVKEQFNNDDLTRLFWQLSMQDRHHSIEVLERTINKTLDDEILSLKELESLNIKIDQDKNIDFNKNIRIDYFYHLAAKTHDRTNNDDEYFRVNVLGLKNILSYVSKLKISKIIMLSSIKVNGEGFNTNDKVYSIHSKLNPKDAYGRSKLEAENLLKEFCKINNINYVILRPPLVYGAGVKGNLSSLMNLIDKNIPMPIVKTNNMRSLISLTKVFSSEVSGLSGFVGMIILITLPQ